MAIGDESSPSSGVPAPSTIGNGNLGTGTTSFPTIDHNHPLFLQPKDTPRSTLISLKLTRFDNYALWSRAIRICLLGKSRLGFVDDRFPKTRFELELHDQWEKVNAVVLSWIMNSVRLGLLSSDLYASDAHKVWEDLKEKFDKVNDLWDEFDALMPCHGCPSPESKKYSQHFEAHRLLQFLVGLNETYAQARSQIMMMSHVPSINKAYSLLVDQESQRNLATCQQSMLVTEGIQSTTLYSNKGNETSGGNYKFEKSQVQCEYCHYKGHTKENCYKLIEYPPDFKTKRKGPASTPDMYANGSSGVEFTVGDTTYKNTQPHCAPTQTNDSYQQNEGGYPCYHQILQLLSKRNEEAPGSSSRLAAIGTLITLMTKFVNKNWIIDTGASNHMTSRIDMLNSHSSINKENKNTVHLPNGEMDLYIGQVNGIGKENHGQYILQGEGLLNFSTQSAGRCLNTFGVSSGSEPSSSSSTTANSSYYSSSNLWHKRYTWIFLINSKSEVVVVLRDFLVKAKNLFSTGVKYLRTDNGSEFFSYEFTSLLTTLGIMHKSSCVYTPKYNRVVERKHRTILEMARSLRFQASIPLRFWGEYVTTTIYLINRLPSKVIGYKTPFEMLYLYPPSVQHLRVFGCLCYASSPKVHDKFSPRAIPTVLMVNKNVTFQEDIYPFKHIKQVSNLLFPVLEFVPSALDTSATSTIAPHNVTQPSPAVSEDDRVSDHLHLPNITEIPTTSEAPVVDSLCTQELRKYSRTSRPPLWLQDYVVQSKRSKCTYPILAHMTYSHISTSYYQALSAYSAYVEPQSFLEIVKDPHWMDAMKLEITALEDNHT
ncbi:uncharacterized protein LOC142179903 [Nicotiana tabacum]|uniref:Uncharacterized protein LOC142179903 n=1 Tax=Nicotiana tabacum TaxID=4097 RepID=A0AC58UBM5_TOBAC